MSAVQQWKYRQQRLGVEFHTHVRRKPKFQKRYDGKMACGRFQDRGHRKRDPGALSITKGNASAACQLLGAHRNFINDRRRAAAPR
jgi:hypothetical protein